MNLKALLLFLFLIPCITNAQSNRVLVFDGNWVSEEAAIDWVIKRYIPIISIEHPKDINRFRNQLREWNPRIKNWKKIKSWTPINVYHKNPVWDVSLGFHTYSNSEELIVESATIDTKTFGPTLDVRATFTHSLTFFSYINYKMLKKNNLDLSNPNKSYSFPVNHTFTFGIYNHPKFTNWTWEANVEREELSFISFNNKIYRIKTKILQNLQVSKNSLYWVHAGLGWRFTINDRGNYINLLGGYSALGTKKLDDGNLKEDVTGFKFHGSWKSYIVHRMWIKGYAQITRYEGVTGTFQQQLGFYTGYTF
ncbi:MAG: hypothetical protein KC493_08070 [Bacteriovoracaceae bacterium]|nr:hypothetical protein [Bacteriovoracaceae bacterium]